MSATLSQQVRELAERLRKEADAPPLPKPTPNPVASRAKGDLGSLENVGKLTGPKVARPLGVKNV